MLVDGGVPGPGLFLSQHSRLPPPFCKTQSVTQCALTAMHHLVNLKQSMTCGKPAFAKHDTPWSSHVLAATRHSSLLSQSGSGGAHQSPICHSHLGGLVCVAVQTAVVVVVVCEPFVVVVDLVVVVCLVLLVVL